MVKILIVGAGFVGSTLSGWLVNKQYSVRVADRVRRPLDDRVEFVECDIRDYDSLRRATEGVDVLIHTAIIQIPQVNEEKRLGYEVNVKGTQNVCEAVRESKSVKGMILTGSWHTIGERNIRGIVDETFGFRPDMVEERARIYAISKIAQESIVRLFGEESSDKIYGVIRIGTTLGPNMPPKTAANIFIDQALNGQPLTPYDYSMHRPMLYAYVNDVCRAFESYSQKIINGTLKATDSSLAHVVNVYYPRPMTILDLAMTVKRSVTKVSKGKIRPEVKIVKTKQKSAFSSRDKQLIRVNVSKVREFLGLKKLTSPSEAIEEIVKLRLAQPLPQR
ncbi:MAG: NAD(P)-dependent oxidoreductase [Candidatus Bathyarchaeia archaeon]